MLQVLRARAFKMQITLCGERGAKFAFPVTTGVAQGCVLSPLLFLIYIDDLLKKFRERGFGEDLISKILNALAFADDLSLIAMGVEMVREFLTILDKWCKRNHFDINLKKSGYFAIHNDSSDDDLPVSR